MELYICEKPSLARAIAKGLGSDLNETAMQREQQSKGYIEIGNKKVTHCMGHMLELLDPEDHDPAYAKWDLELLPMRFPAKMKVKTNTAKQYKIISTLLKSAKSLVNCGDPDEEGQLLVDEIIAYEKCEHLPAKRLLVADLNETAVKKSIAEMKSNADYMAGGKVALARSISDQMFGYNLTRAYTLAARKKGYDGVINIGRVQTAIVNMIYERCKAVKNHTESFYYKVVGNFEINGIPFPAFYEPKESDPLNEKGQLDNFEFAQSLSKSIENKPSTIESAIHKNKFKAAPMPYTLATLQSDCARKFGITAQETLDIAQSLYEKHKVITYPRSNCSYLGDDHFSVRHDVLTAIVGTSPAFEPFKAGANTTKPHKAFNSKKVGAHHGIVPTDKKGNFASFSDNEKKVYNLVARAYIGCLYPDAEYASSDLKIKIADLQFSVSSETSVSKGWEVLYQNDSDNPDIEETAEIQTPLSTLNQGMTGTCKSGDTQKKKAPAPKYFVESTLLRKLTHIASEISDPELRKVMVDKFKADGLAAELGTEATRAAILEKVFESGMAQKVEIKGYKEKAYVTTEIAEKLLPILPNGCKTVDVTASWVNMGNEILSNSMSVTDYVDNVYKFLDKEITAIKSNGLNIKINTTPCPKCKTGHLRLIKGNNGNFYGCTNHPDCNASYPQYKNKPFTDSHNCPECKKPLILRNTKNEYWFGCSGFKDGCKASFACTNGKPTKRPPMKSKSSAPKKRTSNGKK